MRAPISSRRAHVRPYWSMGYNNVSSRPACVRMRFPHRARGAFLIYSYPSPIGPTMNFSSKAKYIALSTLTAAFTLAAPISQAAKQDSNSTQIVGGSFVPQGSYPWTAALLDSNMHQLCGGSLIAPQWVVTAAHCVDFTAYVRIGSIDRDAGGVVASVVRRIKHPNYFGITDDIAVLRLDHPITTITPVQLATPVPAAGSATRLLGWGQITSPFGGDFGSKYLKYLDTFVTETTHCSTAGQGDLCIEATTSATPCKGDSGGPALVNNMLVGVTSRTGNTNGNFCGDNVIYTSIAGYRAWILSQMDRIDITSMDCPGKYQNRPQSFYCTLNAVSMSSSPTTTTWEFIGHNGVIMDESNTSAWGYCEPRQYVQFKVTVSNALGGRDSKLYNYLCD